MVLIGLLLIALVCLALGLVLASAGWLIGSLAASAAAAWVLWRGRDRIVAAGAAADMAKPSGIGTAPTHAAAPLEVKAVATSAPSQDAAVADTPAAADYARRRADELSGVAQAQAPAAAATPVVAPAMTETTPVDVDVWVIDGRPNYHTAHCGVLLTAESETIPHSQAVEDGFTPCTLCDPDAHPERAVAPAGAAQQASAPVQPVDPGDLRQVLVVDGWPHYHAPDCSRLAGAESEPIPFGQAVEDGFTPCPTCQPAVIEPAPQASEPEPVAAADPVVVTPVVEPEPAPAAVAEPEPVVAAEPASAVATEPGLVPEPVVAAEPEPAAAEPDAEAGEPAATEPAHADVWVVPGRPRFHQQGCMIIGDQGAVAVPYAQAVDDGFKPCSLCEPI